ncbi:MAG: hypothetical protein RSB25_21350, partial [Acinetobacter sp.]
CAHSWRKSCCHRAGQTWHTSGRAKAFNAAGDYAPDLNRLLWLGANVGVRWVLWVQQERAIAAQVAFAGEVPIQLSHHNVAVLRAHVLVHHQQIPIKQACTNHAVTCQL